MNRFVAQDKGLFHLYSPVSNDILTDQGVAVVMRARRIILMTSPVMQRR